MLLLKWDLDEKSYEITDSELNNAYILDNPVSQNLRYFQHSQAEITPLINSYQPASKYDNTMKRLKVKGQCPELVLLYLSATWMLK